MAETNAPYVLEPKAGVVYTPRAKRKSVVVFRGLMETVHEAETREEGNELLRDYMDTSFGFVEFENLPREHRMMLRGHMIGSDAAADRYDEAFANGRRGGRPRVELDRETLEQDYRALGSWDKVAEKHGVSRRTIFNERARWEDGDLGKNLNKNKYKNTNKNTPTNETARPAGRSGAQSAVVSEEEVAEAKKKLKRANEKLNEFLKCQRT